MATLSGQIMGRLFLFLLRVVRGFMRNQGFLLSGAVAYYTLLSIVPLSILVLVVLTHFLEEEQLIPTLSTYLGMVIPGYAAALTAQAQAFLEHRKAVGVIGVTVMLFFSSLAFTMLEKAISVIFFQRVKRHRRFLISAIIPYAYIIVMGLGIVLVSLLVGAIETWEIRQVTIVGWSLNVDVTTRVALYLLGILGEVLLLTSLYLVMPVVRVRFRHALVGGITATVLWEITRRLLIWYYGTVSMVNIIYGSISITVVALLSIEVVALILLLGAQVIAELEHSSEEPAREGQSGFET